MTKVGVSVSEFGVWFSEFGVRSFIFRVRSSEFHFPSSEFGVSFSEFGFRSSVYGVWFLVFGIRCSVSNRAGQAVPDMLFCPAQPDLRMNCKVDEYSSVFSSFPSSVFRLQFLVFGRPRWTDTFD